MSIVLRILDIAALGAIGVIIGVIANSRNSIGLVNAVSNLFSSTLGTAAGTIR